MRYSGLTIFGFKAYERQYEHLAYALMEYGTLNHILFCFHIFFSFCIVRSVARLFLWPRVDRGDLGLWRLETQLNSVKPMTRSLQ